MRIVRGIVNLYERQQVRLFVRRDAFRRFYSCLVYVPRDRYNTQVRQRIEAIVREDFHGTAIESQVQLSDSVLARLHLLVRTDPQDQHRADTARIEERIAAAVRTWADGFKDALLASLRRSRRAAAVRALRQPFSARLPGRHFRAARGR